MKKALLIILLFVLPWQALVAAERNFTHVMSSGTGGDFQYVGKHMAEHDAHVLHHHGHDDENDDDGEAHVDKSDQSVQHLNDYEHGASLNVLLPASPLVAVIVVPQLAPVSWTEPYSDRTTLPPLPPPRARA